MAADERVLKHLATHFRVRVRGGFEEYESILGDVPLAVRDELGHDDPELEFALEAATRAEIAELQEAVTTWPRRTQNDLIDIVFAELNAKGIIALQNAGYTMSEGWADVREEARHRPKARGAVFYHGQDLERAVRGEGLYLAFGAIEQGPDERARTLKIGQDVAAALAKHGIPIEWDGTIEQRIQIPPFEWQRRLRPR